MNQATDGPSPFKDFHECNWLTFQNNSASGILGNVPANVTVNECNGITRRAVLRVAHYVKYKRRWRLYLKWPTANLYTVNYSNTSLDACLTWCIPHLMLTKSGNQLGSFVKLIKLKGACICTWCIPKHCRPNVLFDQISIFIGYNREYWHCNVVKLYATRLTTCTRCTFWRSDTV